MNKSLIPSSPNPGDQSDSEFHMAKSHFFNLTGNLAGHLLFPSVTENRNEFGAQKYAFSDIQE